MFQTRPWEGIPRRTTLAADESISGQWLDLGNVQGSISLFLTDRNGASTSIDLSFVIGVFPVEFTPAIGGQAELEANLLEVTPAANGTIQSNGDLSVLTNNILHKTLTLPDGRFFKFTVANDSGMADADVDLLILGQI